MSGIRIVSSKPTEDAGLIPKSVGRGRAPPPSLRKAALLRQGSAASSRAPSPAQSRIGAFPPPLESTIKSRGVSICDGPTSSSREMPTSPAVSSLGSQDQVEPAQVIKKLRNLQIVAPIAVEMEKEDTVLKALQGIEESLRRKLIDFHEMFEMPIPPILNEIVSNKSHGMDTVS